MDIWERIKRLLRRDKVTWETNIERGDGLGGGKVSAGKTVVSGGVDVPMTFTEGEGRVKYVGDVKEEWEIGEEIAGLYKVVGRNDTGGMGVVYFVEHKNWRRRLAVKTPRVRERRVEVRRKMFDAFISEAETWVNLGLHPHIVSCYYVRELGGLPRVFVEYMEGGSLKEWIKEREQRIVREVVDYGIQISRGLSYAHSRGVIHRDIKPGNCLLKRDGRVKVTDFGLAKACMSLGGIEIEDRAGGATIIGGIIGTPEYMAPEQFEGETTERSDIYSFGVMLYEMLKGERPFRYEPPANMRVNVYRKVHKEVKPEEIGMTVKGLKEVIYSCLEKREVDRPSSFEEIEKRLVEIYEGIMGEGYPREKLEGGILVASDLNNRGLSLLDLGREEEAEKVLEEAAKKDPGHVEAVYNLNLLRWGMGKIDDMRLVREIGEMVNNHPGEWLPAYLLGGIHLERGDKESALRVLEGYRGKDEEVEGLYKKAEDFNGMGCIRTFEGHKAEVWSVCISADGRYVLSGGEDKTIKLWEIKTGICIRTFEGHKRSVESVCISADGRYVLSGSADKTIKLWDIETGRCIRTFGGHEGSVESVCISPDGRYVLSGSLDKSIKLWEIKTGRCLKKLWKTVKGRCIRTFEGHGGWVSSVCISTDGRYILSGSEDKSLKLWFLDFELEAREFVDFDERARVYLQIFLEVHRPYKKDSLIRTGRPQWTEEDFEGLVRELGNRGFGYLRKEGIRQELEKMAKGYEAG